MLRADVLDGELWKRDTVLDQRLPVGLDRGVLFGAPSFGEADERFAVEVVELRASLPLPARRG